MAANYDLPSVVEKRVRFFDGQFLQEQDFVDEQKYHLDRERRHLRVLHVAGIADGLAVAAKEANQVTIAPGTAIDSDGRQLALAQTATVDLPADRFNDKQGIELYLSYRESAEDEQTEAGSRDFTRWLERPELTPIAPGEAYAGATPPVLLARLALDNQGRVTVDDTVRSYSGLRLPGPAADAPTLRTTASGLVRMAGSLTVDGTVGIGATSPNSDLQIGDFQGRNRYLALKVQGGNAYRAGIRLWAYKENFGYSIEFDERVATGNGLHIRTHNLNADGESRVFVAQNGNVGIGTTAPPARLSVVAPGATEIAGTAHSAVLRTSAGALGAAAGNETALSSTGVTVDKNHVSLGVRAIRTAAGSDWRTTALGLGMDVDNTVRAGAALFLHANGNVGIGTSTPGAKLVVSGGALFGGALFMDGTQKIQFNDQDISNNLKLQLWSGYGLGINSGTMFYAAREKHSWRDQHGANERMALWTAADGGLNVKGTGASSFAGSLGVGAAPSARLSVVHKDAKEIAGSAQSAVVRVSAGALGTTAGSEVALSSTGLTVTNNMSLGVRAIRTAAGSDWKSAAIGLGMDVDNTVRAGAALFLHANGNVGIGATSPNSDLQIGDFQGRNRYLTLKVQGGNAYRAGVRLWAYQENYGYSLEFDERVATGNGLHIRTHSITGEEVSRVFVGLNGNVGIGTTTPEQKLTVNGELRFTGGTTISSAGRMHIFGDEILFLLNRGGVVVGKHWGGNGNLHVDGTFTQASDARLKQRIQQLESTLDRLTGIRGVSYLPRQVGRRADRSEERPAIGVLAQEVEAVFPQLVSTPAGDGYKAVDYNGLTAVLLEAVKELKTTLDALQARVAALRAHA